MARLPLATRETVPANQAATFDEITKTGGVPKQGPGSILTHVPEAAKAASGLNRYLREKGCLPKKAQELAMLVTARTFDCQYIWNAHAASGKAAGLSAALVDALRDGKELPKLAPDEAAVINYGREFYKNKRVSRGAYQLGLEQFGKQGLIELTLVFGNYAMLAFVVNAFDAEVPSERTEAVLPVF